MSHLSQPDIIVHITWSVLTWPQRRISLFEAPIQTLIVLMQNLLIPTETVGERLSFRATPLS